MGWKPFLFQEMEEKMLLKVHAPLPGQRRAHARQNALTGRGGVAQ
jgi:hypothetical protein